MYRNQFKSKLRKVYNDVRDIKNRISRFPSDRRLGELANTDLILKQKTGRLLSCQRNDSVFERIDIIIKLLTIDELFKGGNRFELFKKMIKNDKNAETSAGIETEVEIFRSFIQRISKDGFKNCDPIHINTKQKITDGSSRLSAALYFGIDEVPIEIKSRKPAKRMDIPWLSRNGFEEKEIRHLEKCRHDLFMKWGLYFPIILWPPIQNYFNQIESELSKDLIIISSKDYSFRDDNSFKALAHKLYEWEAVEDSYITNKVKGMIEYPLKVRMICIDLPKPVFQKNEGKRGHRSLFIKEMKEEMRRKYSDKIDNYFRDIIIHMGDNFDHNQHILQVFNSID